MAVTVYGPTTSSGSGAPSDAKYITQTANATLSAEQAMGSLATGIVKNTTTTGVQSIAAQGTDFDLLPQDTYLQRAKLYVTYTSKLKVFYDPFLSFANWAANNTGTGATANSTTYPGAMQLNAGASSGGIAILRPAPGFSGSTPASFQGGVQNVKYYIRFRMAPITAVDAQALLVVGTGAGGMFIGFNGNLSTSFFTFQSNGGSTGSITSTIAPVNGTYNVHEVWSDGSGTMRYAVDGETVQSTSGSGGTWWGATGSGDYLQFKAGNGTTNTSRAMVVTELFTAVESTI